MTVQRVFSHEREWWLKLAIGLTRYLVTSYTVECWCCHVGVYQKWVISSVGAPGRVLSGDSNSTRRAMSHSKSAETEAAFLSPETDGSCHDSLTQCCQARGKLGPGPWQLHGQLQAWPTGTTQFWETIMSTCRNKCWVSGLLPDRSAAGLVRSRLTQASSIVCNDSDRPTYLDTICVLSDVAQIWVVSSQLSALSLSLF